MRRGCKRPYNGRTITKQNGCRPHVCVACGLLGLRFGRRYFSSCTLDGSDDGRGMVFVIVADNGWDAFSAVSAAAGTAFNECMGLTAVPHIFQVDCTGYYGGPARSFREDRGRDVPVTFAIQRCQKDIKAPLHPLIVTAVAFAAPESPGD